MTTTPATRLDSPNPAIREQAAREAIEYHRQRMSEMAAIRASAVQELKEGRTWAQVADLLGVSEPTAWNIAHPKTPASRP